MNSEVIGSYIVAGITLVFTLFRNSSQDDRKQICQLKDKGIVKN